MIDNHDDLLTVAEVAGRLAVTPHTVYRWIATGRLPAVRYSRKVIRVRRSDLAGLSPTPGGAVREPAVAYQPGTKLSEAELERERRRVQRLLAKYRRLASRPRSPEDPAPGSREALLRLAGLLTHEEAEELRRVIREAKTYSPDVEL